MRDLELLLEGARKLDVPLLIGTAGGAGAEPHVQETHELIVEVAREKGFHFSLATIYYDLTKDYLHERIKAGETGPLDGAQSLTHEAIEKCDRIVGVMGIEPYVAALSQGAEVVIAGRSSDTAIFAAPPLMAGRGVAPAWHSGKILECGASSAVPMAPSDCMLAWVEDGAFEVEPANPDLACTPLSVAAHTMYENPSPYLLREPSGELDTRDSRFIPIGPRRVRVEGSMFRTAARYSVKLEATRLLGYRTIALGVTRDPLLIENADLYVACLKRTVEERVGQIFAEPRPSLRTALRQWKDRCA